jgi:superfamily II DNA or RNA helicase
MSKLLKVLRDGNLLSVRVPAAHRYLFEEELSYFEKIFLRGREAQQARRDRRSPISFNRKSCFTYDDNNRFTFRLGLQDRFVRKAKSLDYQVLLKDVGVAVNPAAFQPDWDGVTEMLKTLNYPDFRKGQRELLEMVARHDVGRVDCPTGWGKTSSILLLRKLFPKARMHVIIPSIQLLNSTYFEAMKHFGSVGVVGGGKRILGENLMLFSHRSLKYSDFRADLVIGDEVHSLVSDDPSTYLYGYDHCKMFGLSASHERADNRHFIAEEVFGPVRLVIPYEQAVKDQSIVPITVVWKTVDCPNNWGDVDNPEVLTRQAIWRNKFRNKLIAETAREYFQKGEQVLLVCRSVDHAVRIYKYLPEFSLVYKQASMPPSRLESLKKAKLLPDDHVALTPRMLAGLTDQFKSGSLRGAISTSCWDQGMDFRKLTVVVRPEGTTSKRLDIQVPGRGSRIIGGEKEAALLIDFWDEFDERLERRSASRRSSYEKQRWAQIFPEGFGSKKKRSSLEQQNLFSEED